MAISWSRNRSEILPFVVDAASSLGYADLREQQKDAILPFWRGTTCSWLFQQAMGRAYVMDAYLGLLRRSKAKSIVVVISPLQTCGAVERSSQ